MLIRRRTLPFLAAAALMFAPATASAATQVPPDTMAALGDSMTRGFNACTYLADCPASSWSTGSEAAIGSHASRIRAVQPSLTAHNDAKTGAKVADLAAQAQQAVTQRADYVTVLIGANDACTSSEATMTSVADFETRFRTALQTLNRGLPSASILVASVPNVKRLWELGKDDAAARDAWAKLKVCRSLLADPTSTSAADVQRRERVHQRVVDFNAVLAKVCRQQANCKYDGGAVHKYRFTLANFSTWDYFHPNASGQRALAQVTYAAGYGW